MRLGKSPAVQRPGIGSSVRIPSLASHARIVAERLRRGPLEPVRSSLVTGRSPIRTLAVDDRPIVDAPRTPVSGGANYSSASKGEVAELRFSTSMAIAQRKSPISPVVVLPGKRPIRTAYWYDVKGM